MKSADNTKPKNVGGRPRKFNESSRPITVTLPDRTLRLLASVDRDRARAIAKATDWITRANEETHPPLDLVHVGDQQAVIVTGPSRSLQEIPWLRLVEIAPARFLLVIPTGSPIERLEVAIVDKLEHLNHDDAYERDLLTKLKACLTEQRRSGVVSKAEILFVETATN
ncbi:MAG: hypothetical protein U0136_10865 [Bdellovibrionota bacterium]